MVSQAQGYSIKACGVERTAVPLEHLLMLRVIVIDHSGNEVLVAWCAADIVGWRGIGTAKTQGAVGQFLVAKQGLLDLDPVLPVIAEVIDVLERQQAT